MNIPSKAQMFSWPVKYLSFLALLLTMFHTPLQAAGLMTPKGSNLPSLDIQEHHVDVFIDDGYAVTTIDQVFYNPNNSTLEAIYSFPLPEKSAVVEFTYWIDGKPVTAEVIEKKKAREIYQQEKAQGRETAITEKDKHLSFDSTVYPVLPQQAVTIRLVYIQAAHVDSGIGRYVYPLESGGVDEAKMAFWSYNQKVTQAFSFNVRLRSSYPLDIVRLPEHPHASAKAISAQEWSIHLANATSTPSQVEENGHASSNKPVQFVKSLDRDIVVYWRHKQGLPGSIDMITHKNQGESRGTFMLTVTPGDDLKTIERGRDWIFVLDLSGSMQGKYHSLVEGVNQGLKKLNQNDRFKIILFNERAREITQGYTSANLENVKHYTQQLENTKPSGGTNLYAGLSEGIRGLDADRPSAIILVTDGVANIGTTEKGAFLNLLKQHDVRLFTFIMGNSTNRPLLDGMTKVSNGFAMSVSNSDDIVGKLVLATSKLTHEALHGVKVDFNTKGLLSVKVKDVTPEKISSLYHGQQLIIFGHYWGEGISDVTISGKISGQKKIYSSTFEFPKTSQTNPEIERLWAYASIEDLQNKMDYFGENSDSKQAIVDIAKEYGIVTDYTSMIIVREEVFEQHAIDRHNKKRVEQESQAREQRRNTGAQDRRIDTQQPAYKSQRAYSNSGSSGGGAIAYWLILILTQTLLIRARHLKH